MKNISAALRRDIQRALRGHTYEIVGDGRILLPKAKAFVGGVFEHNVNGLDPRVDPNLMVNEGLLDILLIYFDAHAQRIRVPPGTGAKVSIPAMSACAIVVREASQAGRR